MALVERAGPPPRSIQPSTRELKLRDVSTSEAPGVAEFRALMSRFATGVCVIAVEAGETGISGMTVNSLVSVSLDPMLVSWSLQNASSQFDRYAGAERFSISILREGQADLAMRYASRADSQLRSDDFVTLRGGLPVVAGALGHVECTRWATYPAGDHTMILGEVADLDLAGQDEPPLAFFDGRFCRIDR